MGVFSLDRARMPMSALSPLIFRPVDDHEDDDHDVVVVTYAVFIAKQLLSQTSRPSNEVV